MKILMILPQAFWEPKGTSFSTLNRLRVLSKLGHQVDLLTYPVGKDVEIRNVRIYRIPNILFVKRVRIGPSWIKLVFDLVLIAWAVKMLITREYDLIHSHEEAGFFSTFLAKIFGKYHIYDMHSSLPQQLRNFQFTEAKILIGIFSLLEKMTIYAADGIIAICPALYDWVKKIAPKANLYLIENVLDNTIDEENSKTAPEELRRKYKLDGKQVVLYAGTFEKYQGLDLFIEGANRVIEKYDDVHFLLVGGTADQIVEYRKQVEQKGLSDYFTFTGSVSPNEVASFYQLSDVLISPRLEGNNTPLKIYAYLRSGKPIVATKHITHTQVLNEEVAMLTDISPQAFAQGIIQILENENLARRLSYAARELANKRYSQEHYVKQMKTLLNSIEKR